MKRISTIISAACLAFLIPFAIASGQEKKNEQTIKIVISDDGGSKVILDTLITGKPLSDSIVLKNGNTIYLANEDSDNAPGAPGYRKYIITTTESDEDDNNKQINKEVTIIRSDEIQDKKGNDKCKHINSESSVNEKKYSYTIESDNNETDSERTKYVIDRDGVKITVEGSDYNKVRELTKEIEKTLEAKSGAK
jgi:hypothetical protein